MGDTSPSVLFGIAMAFTLIQMRPQKRWAFDR